MSLYGEGFVDWIMLHDGEGVVEGLRFVCAGVLYELIKLFGDGHVTFGGVGTNVGEGYPSTLSLARVNND